jgi:hypothetical protein
VIVSYVHTRVLGAVTAALTLAAPLAVPVRAQVQQDPEQKTVQRQIRPQARKLSPKSINLGEIDIPESAVQTNKRAPIPFKPIQVLNPKTRQPAPPPVPPKNPPPQAKLKLPVIQLKPKTVHDEKNWGGGIGDQKLVEGHYNAKIVLDGTADATKVSADFNAGGYVLSKGNEMIRAGAQLTSPSNGDVHIGVKVDVMGDTILNVDENAPGLAKSDNIDNPFQWETCFKHPFGPLTVGGKIGVKGDVGFFYIAMLHVTKARLHGSPYAYSDVYLQAVALVGTSAIPIGGIEGVAKMTVVDVDLNMTGDMSIGADALNKLYYQAETNACGSVAVCSGKVYVRVWISWLDDNLNWVKKTLFKWVIAKWAGYKGDGCLWSEKYKKYLWG